MKWWDWILIFWMLSFKPAFSLSSFTFIKRLFSSSLLSVISVVSSAYLRLLVFLLAILIPACASSRPAFCMMHFVYKLNKQGDNIQPWSTTRNQRNINVVRAEWRNLERPEGMTWGEPHAAQSYSSIQSFTFTHSSVKGLFSFSLLSAIKAVSSAYLRLCNLSQIIQLISNRAELSTKTPGSEYILHHNWSSRGRVSGSDPCCFLFLTLCFPEQNCAGYPSHFWFHVQFLCKPAQFPGA